MKYPLLTILSVVLMLISCNTNNQDFKLAANEQPLSNAEVEAKVNALYDEMSAEERLAQIHGMTFWDLIGEDGHIDTAKCRQLIPNGIGHFSQYASQAEMEPNQLRDLVAEVQGWIMENTPHGIPALFHEEVLAGAATLGATTYPQQIGLACSFNTELAAKKTQETAASLRKIGGMLALSPMVDVCRTPSFNRLEESYGEDCYLSAAMGVAFVQGLQYGGLHEGVAACSKHFLGYGGGGDAKEKEIMEDILMPHEAMIRIAGSKVVMTGYHAVDGTNCVANKQIQQGILRDYLHFDGLMVSDYTSIDQIPDNNVVDQFPKAEGKVDFKYKAAVAINAGNDVEFPQNNCYQNLPQAIKEGLVAEETFEKAVKRVLTLKCALGLLDENPKLYANGHIEYDTPEERATAYALASQSVVMLKNNGVLPLSKPQNIAVTGPNANSMWAMLGDYTYHAMAYFWHDFRPKADNPRIVNLLQGLNDKKPTGFNITYRRGCDWTDENETTIETSGDQRAEWLVKLLNRRIEGDEPADREGAIKMEAENDVIIAAMGENDLLCGENRDRGSLRLPGSQEQYVRQLIATGKPVVLVVFGGRAQVLGDLVDQCAAVIQAWYPGEEGGNALADILYGNISPSGKLSVSYPAVELNEPICYSYSVKPDSRIQFPFGFGMSYTAFEYSNLNVPDKVSTADKSFNLSFEVENTGKMDADEIVQIYLSPAEGQNIRPIQLQGFGRMSLKSGEKGKATFLMSPDQFAYYEKGKWTIAPGKYLLQIGASSADMRLQKEITLTGEKVTKPLRDIYFSEMQ